MNVDIVVPAINRTYEFELENEKTFMLIVEEIAETICQKEHCELDGDIQQMLLLKKNGKSIVNLNETPIQADVKSGDVLILV